MRQLDSTNAPRWEWRTFGVRLSDIEAIIGLAARIAPRRSDEIYLLNSATPHSAKIRGGVLEVKRLLQVELQRARAMESRVQGTLSAFGAHVALRVRRARASTHRDTARSL